jgi:hypothetical protein
VTGQEGPEACREKETVYEGQPLILPPEDEIFPPEEVKRCSLHVAVFSLPRTLPKDDGAGGCMDLRGQAVALIALSPTEVPSMLRR